MLFRSIDQIGTLALTNVGTATDTFSITVQPMGNGPAPSLSNNIVQLDPGQTQNISVELAGSSLDPGAYQGYLQIQGANNPVIASVPYWYGVPSGTAAYETVLYVPANPTPNTRQTIFVRATDSQGLPVGTPPSVTVTAGGGRVVLVQSADSDFPGVFAITVRLGATVGTNVFHIATGDASADVTL